MTLQMLWKKLRIKNKRDYKQFQFVIVFAEMLISSYLMMTFSPLVQKALPDGGDTRKIASLIFGVAVVGCVVFVWYAARLFLRYKSREIGIFLALGAERSTLSKALSAELTKMISLYVIEGIIFGAFLSMAVGKVMELITRSVNDHQFSFTVEGFLSSLLFGVALVLMILLMAYKAMKRTDIMEVINEQRRQEPLKKSVTKGYLVSGFICVVSGIFVAAILPGIYLRMTYRYMGVWSNLFYLVAVFGVYRLLVYSISSHQKGRNPQKYYNNLLYYGMMKFQGASVVRNMLVIVLLIIAGMYAATYIPLMTEGGIKAASYYEDRYSWRYLQNGEMPAEDRIRELASEYGVEIRDYREGEFIRVPGSAVNRDVTEDGSGIIEEFVERNAEYDCISVSEYAKLTEITLDIPKGGYYLIQPEEATESFWDHFDDMSQLYSKKEDMYLSMKYLGNTVYNALVLNYNGLGANARFVINDMDYEALKAGLKPDSLGTQVLFDSQESDGEIAFAKTLFRELVLGMSEEMNHLMAYNPMEEQRVGAENYVDMSVLAVVDLEEPAKETDWWYIPLLVPLISQQTILGSAIRLMLFIYVAAICAAAVGIIGYSRSQSVGESSRQVFEDIKRLGADEAYRLWILKKQIQKVYVLPTVLGIGLTIVYTMVILISNDGVLKSGEVMVAALTVVIGLGIALFQYVMYRKSLKTVKKLLF